MLYETGTVDLIQIGCINIRPFLCVWGIHPWLNKINGRASQLELSNLKIFIYIDTHILVSWSKVNLHKKKKISNSFFYFFEFYIVNWSKFFFISSFFFIFFPSRQILCLFLLSHILSFRPPLFPKLMRCNSLLLCLHICLCRLQPHIFKYCLCYFILSYADCLFNTYC